MLHHTRLDREAAAVVVELEFTDQLAGACYMRFESQGYRVPRSCGEEALCLDHLASSQGSPCSVPDCKRD